MSSDDKNPVNRNLLKELRKLRAVCLFTGGAAHDYNNALTAVMGNISLARLEAGSNRELAELLKDAEKAAGRIKNLTEKIALYARGIRINKSRSSIGDIVQSALAGFSDVYSGTTEVEIKKDLPDVDVDPELIEEALCCIIENACEASPHSGGKIAITVSREEVRNSAAPGIEGVAEGDYIKIAVRDNGKGFKPEALPRMFEPYFSTKEGSDGIGLALAYSILKRHRGFITATLSESGGSVFSVFVPLF